MYYYRYKAHQPVKLKGLAYLSLVDKKKIKFIDLSTPSYNTACASVKQEALKIFTEIDCELMCIYLGIQISIKPITKSMMIASNYSQKLVGCYKNFN